MSQSEHEAWNARHYPGTRQLCAQCGEPTGRCEEDSLYADDDGETGPLCEECWKKACGDERPNVERNRPAAGLPDDGPVDGRVGPHGGTDD